MYVSDFNGPVELWRLSTQSIHACMSREQTRQSQHLQANHRRRTHRMHNPNLPVGVWVRNARAHGREGCKTLLTLPLPHLGGAHRSPAQPTAHMLLPTGVCAPSNRRPHARLAKHISPCLMSLMLRRMCLAHRSTELPTTLRRPFDCASTALAPLPPM